MKNKNSINNGFFIFLRLIFFKYNKKSIEEKSYNIKIEYPMLIILELQLLINIFLNYKKKNVNESLRYTFKLFELKLK